MNILHYLIHTTVYYVAWFACITLAARGYAWISPLIVVACVVLQLYWQHQIGRTLTRAMDFISNSRLYQYSRRNYSRFATATFKKRHKGDVCNKGLWNYSRHPNYFFDWLSWMGFALLALQSTLGYLFFLSPLMLYVIFTHMTGPLTERGSIQSRGQKYIEYPKKTSMFFPWFKKKSGPE